MAIATPDDLRNHMSGIKMSEPQYAAATDIILGVQEELELYLNRPLEVTAMREAVVADENGFVRLSVSPVREIRRITTVSGTGDTSSYPMGTIPADTPLPPFDGPTYDVVPKNLGRDLIFPGGVQLGSYSSYYIIDYVGGGSDFIARHLRALKLAILRVAAREWQIKHRDTVSVANGNVGEPTDPVPPSNLGWMEEELANFDRLRRRTVV